MNLSPPFESFKKSEVIHNYKSKLSTNSMENCIQAKQVQEIAQSCKDEIPEKFVHKNGYPQPKVDSVPYMDDCVIDFSLLSSSSSPEANHELSKLQLALSQWGCFQAVNHGITSEFLDKVREVSKKFFALPLEEKLKYSREMDDYDGYGNDTIVSEQQTLDWTDRLYLTIYPDVQRKLKYWPENPLEFREIINEYTLKVKAMFAFLLKAMALSLNLEENCFLKEHGDSVIMDGRFNFYPPCPTPENVLGFKPHADSSIVTMLLQDKEVEGLQVLKDDKWFRVAIVPDALFINVGDLLEIMSNGMLKSPMHRVVINAESERISVAVFCFSEPDREVGSITGLITDDKPQMYKRVKHYQNTFFENYQLGKRPLHAVRI